MAAMFAGLDASCELKSPVWLRSGTGKEVTLGQRSLHFIVSLLDKERLLRQHVFKAAMTYISENGNEPKNVTINGYKVASDQSVSGIQQGCGLVTGSLLEQSDLL